MGALERCINLLGDADSTAAICGQIVGSFYGARALDKLPQTLVKKWDRGEIALRGALLACLGSCRPSEALTHQLMLKPHSTSSLTSDASLLAGDEAFRDGKYKEALVAYEGAAKHHPNTLTCTICIRRCMVYLEMGTTEHDMVLQSCQDALRRLPM